MLKKTLSRRKASKAAKKKILRPSSRAAFRTRHVRARPASARSTLSGPDRRMLAQASNVIEENQELLRRLADR